MTPAAASNLSRDAGQDRPSLAREMVKGTGWTVLTRLGVQGIGFVSTVILARLLVPADFGLVTLATGFAAAIQAASEFSFDVVLIKNQQATRTQYDTVWTLSVCRNTLLGVLLAAAAGPIASLLGDARLEPIVFWLAIANFIDGFQNVGIVEFRKELAFHKDLVFNIICKLGSFVVTVPLAVVWRNYWALVAGVVANAVIRLLLSFAMHGYRPRISIASWREIMHFSKWLLLNNIAAFLFYRSDTFIIGKLAGAGGVGVYSIAYEIANLLSANLMAPIRRAIYPGFVKMSDDVERLRQTFTDMIALVALVGAPMTVGLGLTAQPVVHLLLGGQWVGSIPLIQILSLYGFLGLVSSGSGPIFMALDKPQYLTWIMIGGVVSVVPLLIVGVIYGGLPGAAWAVTVSVLLATVTDFLLVTRLLRLPSRYLIAAAWRPFVATALMTLAVTTVQAVMPAAGGETNAIRVLLASILMGAAAYSVSVFLLWLAAGRPEGAERHFVKLLLGSLRGAVRRSN